jgi:PAS domain S-box-containing protein
MFSSPFPNTASENGSSPPHPSRILGTGEMADRVRTYDWNATPLGGIETWSKELVTIVNLTLCSPSPARTMWGPEFILIYNDAYRPIPGPRHPAALGKPASTVYGESWHVVGPLLETAFATGKTFFYEKLLVPLTTEDGVKDFYLNYSFNPVFENGKIAGLFGALHDVTSEVTANLKLRESEARASRILQSIGDAVIVTDENMCVTTMNPVAAKLTGWRPEEATGKLLADVFSIVNESTRLPVESPADKVRRTGGVVGLANHTVLIAKDGKETAIDDSGAPILDEDDNLNGIVLVFRDIEERRAAERERERITEQLSQVLGATSDAIVSVNRDWALTYLNRRAMELYSTDREILGQNLWDAFPDAVYEDSPFQEHYYRAMEEGIAGAFEAYYPAPLDLWLRLEVYPTRDGIVTYSRDITKEKAVYEELRQKRDEAERQRFEIETVYRTAPIGLALFDTADFRYLRLNDRQADFFGLTPEQIVGRTLTEMAPIEGLKELFNQVLEGEPVINFPLEGELATRPGEYRYWTVSYFPVLDATGAVQAITAASLEVTQQKKAERALIESEKLAVVGRLASSISHEINNPLEAVTNLLYLVRTMTVSSEMSEYLEAADRELRRVAAITNQTLRFHKQSTNPTEVTSEQLFESVLQLFQGRLQNFGIQIEKGHQSPVRIRCFEGEIRQVLSNLVGNAIDAMHQLGGRLLLRSREGRDHRTGRPGLILSVADTGPGMPHDVAKQAFQPFFTTKGLLGTGLGLWISKEIIDRHSGRILLRSSQREGSVGTTISIFLPFDAVSR